LVEGTDPENIPDKFDEYPTKTEGVKYL